MLSKCHELESELLLSDWVMKKIEMPRFLNSDAMGAFQLKGKQQEVELHSIYMTVDKESKIRRRRRLFRKKTQQVQ